MSVVYVPIAPAGVILLKKSVVVLPATPVTAMARDGLVVASGRDGLVVASGRDGLVEARGR